MSRLTREGTAGPVSRNQILRRERGQRNIHFPVQLITSRIGNLTRLICMQRVRRYRASKPQGSSERVLPWQVTMDQLRCASFPHTQYWYQVGMLKAPVRLYATLSLADIYSTICGGLPLFDESFPNEDATSASRSLQEGSTKPPRGWVKPSRKFREGFSVSSRSLQRPPRLHEALVKTSRTLREGATASPLRECFMKAP